MQQSFEFTDNHFPPHWEYNTDTSPVFVPSSDNFVRNEADKNSISAMLMEIPINVVNVNIINRSDNPLPEYAKDGDSGMDLRAYISEVYTKRKIVVYPNSVEPVNTGLFFEIPYGYEIQLRPRSGLAKLGINLANCIGTIDSNYRGEIICLIHNNSTDTFEIETGDRICQAVLAPVYKISWSVVEKLNDTTRGNGGFGHTGIK
jgi:dUTP pyrophosphatase